MPIFTVTDPDGNTYKLNGPEGATQEDAIAQAQQMIAEGLLKPQPKPKTGIGAAVGKGIESLISSGRTALGALTGSPEEAAQAGLERGRKIGEKYEDQVSLDRVKKAYEERGILPAAGEALSQIPAAIAEQAPNLAAMAGGARLGAMAGAPFGPIGATVGGIGGALAPSLVQQFGGNIERQAQEGAPISTGRAAAAAAPQAALDVAAQAIPFGGRLVQKLTGIPMGAFFSKSAEQAVKIADERLLTTLAKGTAVGALAEIPTEITQQMLERAQAGLSLTSPDAMKEYGETAYQVGLLAPLGAVGRLSERSGARAQVEEKKQAEAAKAAAEQAVLDEEQAAKEQAELDSPEYAEGLKTKLVAAEAEMRRLSEAAKKPPEGADALAVQDAKDAAKQRAEYAKTTVAPLVKELQRVRGLHPDLFKTPIVPTPAAPATVTPPPAAPTAAMPATVTPAPGEVAPEVSAPVSELEVLQKKAKAVEPAAVEPAAVEPAAPVAETPIVEPVAPAVAETPVVAPAPKVKKPKAEKPVAPVEEEKPAPAAEAAAPTEVVEPETPKEVGSLQALEARQKELEAIVADRTRPYKDRVDARMELASIPAKMEQFTLEQREEPTTPAGEPIPRTMISFAPRRRLMEQITKNADYAPEKRSALEKTANDFSQPYAVRAKAKSDLEAYNARVQKEVANKEKTLGKDIELYAETKGQIAAVENELSHELLNQKQLTRLRGGKVTRAELEAPKRQKLEAKLQALNQQLQMREEKIASRSGLTKEQVKRTLLPTKAEKQAQAEETLRRTRGAPVTDVFEEMLAEQPKQRATGPVTRPEIYPPRQFRVGSEEQSKLTQTTPEGLSEARGTKQRDVPISKAEMQEANVAAPATAMGPKPAEAMQALRRERALFDTAQKKVEELNAKLSASKDKVAAYAKLVNKRADVAERLSEEQQSLERELSRAKDDAARLAPKVAAEKPVAMSKRKSKIADIVGSTEGELAGEFEGRLREGTTDFAFRQSTDLTGATLEAVKDGRIKDALQSIEDSTQSEFVRELAQKLRPLLLRTKLRVEDNLESDGKRVSGVYRFETNTVVLDSQSLTEEDFLHELVHAATERNLTVDPSQLTAEQREARAQLEELFHAIQNDSAFEKEYGKLNLHEFAAEVMSNKQLRDKLDARRWKGANLLTKIYRAFMHLIGLNPDRMAGASVDAIYKLFSPSMTAAKAGVTLGDYGVVRPSAVRYAPGLEGVGKTADKVVAKDRGVIDKISAAAGGWLGLETQFVDRFAGFERIAKTMDSLKGFQMMYFLRMYDQKMNFTAQSVANGALQRVAKKRADGRTEYLIESVKGANIKQVVDILKKAPAGSPDAANRLFSFYLAGIRAKNKGFHTLHLGDALTEAELNKAMADIRAVPGLEENFKQAREVYNEYNRNMMEFLAQSGAISKDLAARLTKENDYIPFYREQRGSVELLIGGESPIRIGNLTEQPYLQELVGGDRPILDVLKSSVQNTAMITDMALRNMSTRSAMNELADVKLAQIHKGKGPDDRTTVRFKVDGKDYYARVETDKARVPADLLVKGMAGIPTQFPAAVRLMGMPATLLRKAVQISPLYPVRQLLRDSLAATLTSGANFTPIIGSLAEIKKSATKDTLERRGITGGQIITGTSEDMSKILKDMLANRGNLGTLIAKAEAVNMEADAATRRAQYNSYIKQGLSEMEATLMALESMNFNKRGASPSIHYANALIPFFNSQIQGLNVLYKAMTGKLPFNERLKIQEKFITRGLMIAAGSMAYAAMMQDDEAYKNATPDQKYGNWFVRLPGVDEPVRIPIPFEVGYIFKALPEALYNSMANEHGAEEAFKAMQTIVKNTIPGGSSYFVPQAMKPLLEYGFEKSFYTGRSTLSAREQQLLPEQQFRENTTELTKMMGAGLGLSPIKVEELVRGYTGTMGLALMQAMSMGIPAGESPEKTAKRLSNMPVFGGAFQPNDAGGIIEAVYEKMVDAKKVQTTAERMMQEGRQAEARELIQKRSEEFAQAGVADYFISNIRQITAVENAIRASNMTGEEKRAKLDETRQIKIRLAETVRKATDEAKTAS